MEDLFEKSYKLIKEAASYKKSDINKAISLIEEAIEINPERSFSYYFKLASYIHLSGDSDRAFQVFGSLLGNVDFNDIRKYNRDISTITFETSKQLFKDAKYIDYLFYKYFSEWNFFIADACHAIKSPLELTLSEDFINNSLSGRSEKKAFRELNCEDKKYEFIKKYIEFLNQNRDLIFETCELAFKISTYSVIYDKSLADVDTEMKGYIMMANYYERNPEDRPTTPIVSENYPYLCNTKFMELYKELNGVDFSGFFNEELTPLLKE